MKRITAILGTALITIFMAGTAFAEYMEVCKKDGLTYELNCQSVYKDDSRDIIAEFRVSTDNPITLKSFEEESIFPECRSIFDGKTTRRSDIKFNKFMTTAVFRDNTWKVYEITAYNTNGENITAVAHYKYPDLDAYFESIDSESEYIQKKVAESLYKNQQRHEN